MIPDLRIVSRQLGLLMFVISGFIGAVGLWSVFDHWLGNSQASGEMEALFFSAAIGTVVGSALWASGRKGAHHLAQREALLLVALSWILGAAISAAPFRIWASLRPDASELSHGFDSWIDCYFEVMSGLTTTGATIVESLATVPRALLLWRATTHWLGGLGIVVLFVAVLPILGVGGRRIFRIESPGPAPEGVTPRIRDTARILWLIYFGLTVAEIVALRVCGMSWFDSVCHTFATLATGGFSTVDASAGGFDSSAIHVVLIIFMILAGVNFGLYHQIIQKHWREAVRDPELRLYLTVMFCGTLVVVLSLVFNPPGGRPYGNMWITIRDSLFQVAAVQTTTGFCSADFDQWGFAAKAVLLTLMFVGGCAGSTGGGIKVMRIYIAFKVLFAELEKEYRPRVIRSVKIGRSVIDADLKTSTMIYIFGVGVLFVLGTVGLLLIETSERIDFVTASTASIATLNNIGPGLGMVGATQNYAWFSGWGKAFLCVLMLLGRLEVFTILVIFSPRYWTRE